MKLPEFGKVVEAALEVSAQAHPVKTGKTGYSWEHIIHVLDKDDKLWRISISEPR